MTDPIATREFSCISPTGKASSFTVQIGRPVRATSKLDAMWGCPIDLPFESHTREIYGEDSWQALSLALSLVRSALRDFVERGGKLYYPGTRDEVALDADSIGNS